MILCDLSLFFFIWADSFWSELFLFDLWLFCVISAGSFLCELVLFDVSWFFLIYDGSVWSQLVLFDLSCFFLFWADLFLSMMVLCDLNWFILIWAGSSRSRPFLKNWPSGNQRVVIPPLPHPQKFFLANLDSKSSLPWPNSEHWVAKKDHWVSLWLLHYLLKKRPVTHFPLDEIVLLLHQDK